MGICQQNSTIAANLNLAKYGLKLALDKYPVVRSIDRADAFQAACLGLVIAARTHDPAKGSLSHWAMLVIAQELLRAAQTVGIIKVQRKACKRLWDEKRRQAAMHVGGLSHDFQVSAPAEAPEPDDSALLAALDQLSTRQRVVFRLIYWDGLTRAEVAERLGVTRQRVEQIHSEGVKELRALLGVTWEPKARGRRLSACAS